MQGKMRQDLYQELYHVENTHWWHQHKRATVRQMVAHYAKQGRVLDVGAGTGKILEEFKKSGWQVEGIDGEDEAVKWSKKRGIDIKQADFVKHPLPYQDDSFDAVLALDLLEHLPNDQQVLKEITRVLKPGGIAVITVPAYQWLFNYWDEMLGHQRRYTTSTFSKIINDKLTIKHLGYYFCLFLIPALLVRLIKQVAKSNDKHQQSDFESTPIPWVSILIMTVYAKAERFALQFMRMPFGLSVIAILEKNET